MKLGKKLLKGYLLILPWRVRDGLAAGIVGAGERTGEGLPDAELSGASCSAGSGPAITCTALPGGLVLCGRPGEGPLEQARVCPTACPAAGHPRVSSFPEKRIP